MPSDQFPDEGYDDRVTDRKNGLAINNLCRRVFRQLSNGFMADSSGTDSGHNSDMSPDRSPSPHHDASTQTLPDPLIAEAEHIILDVMEDILKLPPQSPQRKLLLHRPRSRHSATVSRLVRSVLDRHEILFRTMMVRLGEMDTESGYSTFAAVADQVFEGGIVTWGRVVVLFAFAVRLCSKLCHPSPRVLSPATDSGSSDDETDSASSSIDTIWTLGNGISMSPKNIAEYMGSYIGEKVAPWLRDHGGWESLEKAFPQNDELDRKVWKGLLITGLGLGLATAALAVSR